MPQFNPWPLCKCGHIAQDHNTFRNGFIDHHGCDRLGCECIDYRFPDNFPQEQRNALEAQRAKVLKELDEKQWGDDPMGKWHGRNE